MMKYKCIKSFAVGKYDADGGYEGGYIDIEEGSTWEESDKNITGAAVHLIWRDGWTWIEISREHLAQYFEPKENTP